MARELARWKEPIYPRVTACVPKEYQEAERLPNYYTDHSIQLWAWGYEDAGFTHVDHWQIVHLVDGEPKDI